VNGTGLEAGKVAKDGSFQGGEGTWAEADVGEDWTEVGWSVENLTVGGFSMKL
jgi:hypothetical protein